MLKYVSRLGDSLHTIFSWRNSVFQRLVIAVWVFLIETTFMSRSILSFWNVISIAMLVGGMVFIAGVYLRRFKLDIFESPKKLLLLGLLWIVNTFVIVVSVPLVPPYVIPVPALSMIVTILFDYELGILMTVLGALSLGIMLEDGFKVLMVHLLTGIFACFSVSRVVQRNDITKIAPWVSLVSGFFTVTFGLLFAKPELTVLTDGAWGLLGGIVSSVVTMGALPFLETGFKITTKAKLYELSNPDQKLLKDLMTNAPGTYNHSIVVGNLVEAAAEVIGANPMLARASAYYHDIGKMKRPFFFIENQINFNQHDKINPSLSRLIITSHVKEGVEIARENNLPEEIIDIINQHHGTTVVTYFYELARKQRAKGDVSADDYRYQGVRPKSAEAALVMLADSVEAAARTMDKPSLKHLEQLVNSIIHEKLEDGQLDESALTMADLKKVAKAFVQVLSGVYHYRIEYHKNYAPDKKKRVVVHGDFGRQSAKRS